MKKYIKYKDFLPPHYVDKNVSKNKRNNKKAIWMLVILNFYMLPMNIKSIFQENNSKEIVNDTYYDESEKFIAQISEWLKVTSLDIDSIEVTGNKGMISVLNKDVLCEVENLGYEIIRITQDNSIYKANIMKDD